MYKVPKSTGSDKNNKYYTKKKHGVQEGLYAYGKGGFVRATLIAEWSFPLTEYKIGIIAQKYFTRKGVPIVRWKNNFPGKHWFTHFSRRMLLNVRISRNVK